MNVYPSVDELMPSTLKARIPEALARDLEERYQTLGEKYLTDEKTADGRYINSCMNKSSVQDALEEVVDAVFNTLVWIFKDSELGDIPDVSYTCLMGLIEIYSLLYIQRDSEKVVAEA